MSKQQCLMHEDENPSFCTQHVLYCCRICHKGANPGCTVMTTKDASTHYNQLIESSTSYIDDVIQQCSSTRSSLTDLRDDLRQHTESDMDEIVTYCDKLHAAVNTFHEQCIQKIQDQSRKTNERVRELDKLEIFLNDLRDKSPNKHEHAESGTSSALSGNEEQISENLVELNTKATRLNDAVISAEGILLIDCDMEASLSNISMDCQSISDVINHLADELSAVYGRMLTKPEGTAAPCAVISLPPVVDNIDEQLPCIAQESHSFNEMSRLKYWGMDPMLCFIPSSPGKLLVSMSTPCALFKIDDHYSYDFLKVATGACLRGLCIRNNQLFATGSDRDVWVYELDNLSLLRKFSSHGVGYGIAGIGDNFVVSYPRDDDVRVSIITTSGQLVHSTRQINGPWSLLVTPNEDQVLVSDFQANSVFMLSADLSVIKKFHVKGPAGMCSVGQSVYILSQLSNCVMEFCLDGSFVRNVLSKKDGIEDPFRISYHDHSGRLAISCRNTANNIFVFSSKP